MGVQDWLMTSRQTEPDLCVQYVYGVSFKNRGAMLIQPTY